MGDARDALLTAALEEFAVKGFAGARVRDIAERAGVSKDLITYHFGSKHGLYQAVQQAWIVRRDAFVDPSRSLPENFLRYLHETLQDPRPTRMLVWLNLADGNAPGFVEDAYPDFAMLARRQERGEYSSPVDPAVLELLLMGAATAPSVFPSVVRRIFDREPSDPQFEERYRDGLLQVLRVLGIATPEDDSAPDHATAPDHGARRDAGASEGHARGEDE